MQSRSVGAASACGAHGRSSGAPDALQHPGSFLSRAFITPSHKACVKQPAALFSWELVSVAVISVAVISAHVKLPCASKCLSYSSQVLNSGLHTELHLRLWHWVQHPQASAGIVTVHSCMISSWIMKLPAPTHCWLAVTPAGRAARKGCQTRLQGLAVGHQQAACS